MDNIDIRQDDRNEALEVVPVSKDRDSMIEWQQNKFLLLEHYSVVK